MIEETNTQIQPSGDGIKDFLRKDAERQGKVATDKDIDNILTKYKHDYDSILNNVADTEGFDQEVFRGEIYKKFNFQPLAKNERLGTVYDNRASQFQNRQDIIKPDLPPIDINTDEFKAYSKDKVNFSNKAAYGMSGVMPTASRITPQEIQHKYALDNSPEYKQQYETFTHQKKVKSMTDDYLSKAQDIKDAYDRSYDRTGFGNVATGIPHGAVEYVKDYEKIADLLTNQQFIKDKAHDEVISKYNNIEAEKNTLTDLIAKYQDPSVIVSEEELQAQASVVNELAASMSDEERSYLQSIQHYINTVNDIEQEIPKSYRIGEGIGQSLGFMGEIVLTGGLGTTSTLARGLGKKMLTAAGLKKATPAMIKRLAPEVLEETSKKALSKGLQGQEYYKFILENSRKGFSKAPLVKELTKDIAKINLQLGSKSAIMPSTLVSTQKNVEAGDSIGTAYVSAWGNNYRELISEVAGSMVRPELTMQSRLKLKNRAYRKFMDNFAYDGPIIEFGEEMFKQSLDWMVGADERNPIEAFKEDGLSTAISVGAISGILPAMGASVRYFNGTSTDSKLQEVAAELNDYDSQMKSDIDVILNSDLTIEEMNAELNQYLTKVSAETADLADSQELAPLMAEYIYRTTRDIAGTRMAAEGTPFGLTLPTNELQTQDDLAQQAIDQNGNFQQQVGDELFTISKNQDGTFNAHSPSTGVQANLSEEQLNEMMNAPVEEPQVQEPTGLESYEVQMGDEAATVKPNEDGSFILITNEGEIPIDNKEQLNATIESYNQPVAEEAVEEVVEEAPLREKTPQQQFMTLLADRQEKTAVKLMEAQSRQIDNKIKDIEKVIDKTENIEDQVALYDEIEALEQKRDEYNSLAKDVDVRTVKEIANSEEPTSIRDAVLLKLATLGAFKRKIKSDKYSSAEITEPSVRAKYLSENGTTYDMIAEEIADELGGEIDTQEVINTMFELINEDRTPTEYLQEFTDRFKEEQVLAAEQAMEAERQQAPPEQATETTEESFETESISDVEAPEGTPFRVADEAQATTEETTPTAEDNPSDGNVTFSDQALGDLQRKKSAIRTIKNTADKLGLKVEVINSNEMPLEVQKAADAHNETILKEFNATVDANDELNMEQKANAKEDFRKRMHSRMFGYKHNGLVYLHSNQITTISDLKKTLVHEGIAHLGLETIFFNNEKPLEITTLNGEVIEVNTHDELMDAVREFVPQETIDELKKRNYDIKKPRLVADEALAYQSEKYLVELGLKTKVDTRSPMRKLFDALAKRIGKNNSLTGKQYTYEDLALSLLQRSKANLIENRRSEAKAEGATRFKVAESQQELTDFVRDSEVKIDLFHGGADKIIDFDEGWAGTTTADNEHGAFYFSNIHNVADDYATAAFVRRYQDNPEGLVDDEIITQDEFDKLEEDGTDWDDYVADLAEEKKNIVTAKVKMTNPLIVDAEHKNLRQLEQSFNIQDAIGYLKGRDSNPPDIIYDDMSYDQDDINNYQDEINERVIEDNDLESIEDADEWMIEQATDEVLEGNDIYKEVPEYDGLIIKNVIDDIGDKSNVYQDVHIALSNDQILIEPTNDIRFLAGLHGGSDAIDKFDTNKASKEEGNKLFGHGSYFTNKANIARAYAEGRAEEGNRYLYKVKIHGDKTLNELNFLPWDDKSTPETVNTIIEAAKAEGLELTDKSAIDELNAKDKTPEIKAQIKELNETSLYGTNGRVYSKLAKILGSKAKASDMLLNAGIDGIIYKGETSTKTGEKDAENYVVFNDKAISIEEQIRFKAAWHGSPHDISKSKDGKFSTDNIGTGEGNQAFGWGLYFTDKKGIAKSYAKVHDFNEIEDAVSYIETKYPVIADKLFQHWELDDILEVLNRELEISKDNEGIDVVKLKGTDIVLANRGIDAEKTAKAIVSDILSKLPQRNLYKVKIHGDKVLPGAYSIINNNVYENSGMQKGFTMEQWKQEKPLYKGSSKQDAESWAEKNTVDFIRWDKPVPIKVWNALEKLAEESGDWTQSYYNAVGDVNDDLPISEQVKDKNITGEELYRYIQETEHSQEKASKYLLKAGIDGIQYPTESLSKGSHEDSFNYVVFDDKAIEIEEQVRFKVAESEQELTDFVKDSEVKEDVLHGTNQDFQDFILDEIGLDNKGATSKSGFWFTNSTEEAQQYADYSAERTVPNPIEHEKKIAEMFNNIEKAEKAGDYDLAERLTQEVETLEMDAIYDKPKGQRIINAKINLTNPLIVDVKDKKRSQSDIIQEAKDNNHDGVIFKNIVDSPKGGLITTQYLVFNPEQILINPTDNVRFRTKEERDFLKEDNKSTYPKIRTNNIFHNEKSNIPHEESKPYDELITKEQGNIEEVNIYNIIPTQTNLTASNLEKVESYTDKPELSLYNGKYYVVDGHHRIANAILDGEETIEAIIYDPKKADIRFKVADSQQELDDFVKDSEVKETVYHSTNTTFTDFDIEKSTDGAIWFSIDKESTLQKQQSGGIPSNTISAKVSLKNPANWNEYDKLSIDELIRDGYDGAILDDDILVFSNDQILIEPKEEVKFKVEEVFTNKDKQKETYVYYWRGDIVTNQHYGGVDSPIAMLGLDVLKDIKTLIEDFNNLEGLSEVDNTNWQSWNDVAKDLINKNFTLSKDVANHYNWRDERHLTDAINIDGAQISDEVLKYIDFDKAVAIKGDDKKAITGGLKKNPTKAISNIRFKVEDLEENLRGKDYNKPEIKTAKKVAQILKDRGIAEQMSISNTDFGTSVYFYTPTKKIRISDHSVTNIGRMQDEQHETAKSDPIRIANEIERESFPERYSKEKVGENYFSDRYQEDPKDFNAETGKGWVVRANTVTDKQLNELKERDDIRNINETFTHTSKKGNDIYKITFEQNIPLKAEPVFKYERIGGDTNAKVEEARKDVDLNPTEEQKDAGNYKKGHVQFDGFDISIENPLGTERSGIDADGKPWDNLMGADYGYFKNTVGKDKDHVDVFLGEKLEDGNIYIVDQTNPKDGSFDEHKVMYGFKNISEATRAYRDSYDLGWNGLGEITKVGKEDFKTWLYDGVKNKPYSSQTDARFKVAESKEEFDAFVKDSEVKETVYHGTKSEFTNFMLEQAGREGDYGLLGKGIYFTTDQDNAKNYARSSEIEGDERVLSAKISIKNPYTWDKPIDSTKMPTKKEADKITSDLIAKGYDGIKYDTGYGFSWIVAFNPDQILIAPTENKIGTTRFSIDMNRLEQIVSEVKGKLGEKYPDATERPHMTPSKAAKDFNKLQERIKLIKQSQKIGEKIAKERIKEVQNLVSRYAQKVMPTDEARKSEINKLVSTIKKSNQLDVDQIEQAINTIDDLTDRILARRKMNRIEREIKRLTSPKKAGNKKIGKYTLAWNNELKGLKELDDKLLNEQYHGRKKVTEEETRAINEKMDKIAAEYIPTVTVEDKTENDGSTMANLMQKLLSYRQTGKETKNAMLDGIQKDLSEINELAKADIKDYNAAKGIAKSMDQELFMKHLGDDIETDPVMTKLMKKFTNNALNNNLVGIGNWEDMLLLIGGKKLRDEFSLLSNEAMMATDMQISMDDILDAVRSIYKLKESTNTDKVLRVDGTKAMNIIQELSGKTVDEKGNTFTLIQPYMRILGSRVAGNPTDLTVMEVIDIYNAVKQEDIANDYYYSYSDTNEEGKIPQDEDGNYITTTGKARIDDLISRLTPQQKDLGDAMANIAQSFYPTVNKVFQETYNMDLPYNENYWMSTATGIIRDELLENKEYNSTQASMIKSRAAHRTPKPSDAFSKLARHIEQVSFYKNMASKIDRVDRVLRNPNIANLITQSRGKDFLDSMQQQVKDAAESVTGRDGAQYKTANFLLGNWIASKIGMSPTVLGAQLVSIGNYANAMPMGKWAASTAKNIGHAKQTFDWMWENIPYLRTRYKGGYNEAVQLALEAENSFKNPKTGKVKKAHEIAKGIFTLPTSVGDMTAIIYGGKAYIDHLMSEGMSQENAIEKFLESTLRSQQSPFKSSLGKVQKTKNPLLRVYTSFMNTPMQYTRMLYNANIMYNKGDIDKQQLAKTYAIFVAINGIGFIVVKAVINALIKGEEPDWEEIAKESAVQMANTPIAGIPLAKEASTALLRKLAGLYVYEGSTPVLSDISTIFENLEYATDPMKAPDKRTEKLLESGSLLLDVAAGVPTTNLNKIRKATFNREKSVREMKVKDIGYELKDAREDRKKMDFNQTDKKSFKYKKAVAYDELYKQYSLAKSAATRLKTKGETAKANRITKAIDDSKVRLYEIPNSKVTPRKINAEKARLLRTIE